MTIPALALMLAQLGPSVSGGAAPPIQSAPLPIPRAPRAAPAPAAPEPSKLQLCLSAIDENPLSAVEAAQEWLQVTKGVPSAEPDHCLGVAYNRLGRLAEAEVAFNAAREALPASEPVRRASFGAMAALAVLEQGDAARADAAFGSALAEAKAGGDARLAGDIAIDRARAQVALKQDALAAAGLAEARTASPENPAGWLLSATLARRQEHLADAQRFVQRAAELAPFDPDIGLEAGVIAVLGGRDEAARKSWLSVLKVAPESEQAKVAQGYLDQLGPAPVAAPTAAPEGR
jgi:tetratricopeptide (TPR) repeat protein